MTGQQRQAYSLGDLLRIMERLRDPDGGCPWDLAQDFRSIVPSTLEECYELANAIEHEDYAHVAEELGDVLFQVVFYAQLGRERNLFSFPQVVDTLARKLLRRHPHVFADGDIEKRPVGAVSVEQVKDSWESIKQSERHQREQTSILDDVPLALPALPRAQKLQKRASLAGFDWPEAAPVVDKLQEELDELRAALSAGDAEHSREELGDLLFTCANLARHLAVDAEACLRDASSKFEHRFRAMEQLAAHRDQQVQDLEPGALDALWEAVKGRQG